MENSKNCVVDCCPVRFAPGELEVALCTYNRPNFIRILLPQVYEECIKRNIHFRIVDASTSNESEQIIYDFNEEHEIKISYTKVDSDTLPGYMQMEAINTSESNYVWVYADSRRVEFAEFDEKVFPIIKDGIDMVVFFDGSFRIPDRIYMDVSEFLHDCMVPFTCTGCSIYRRSIFGWMENNRKLKGNCDNLFEKNYAFSWMGYSLYALAQQSEPKVYFCKVDMKPVMKKKNSSWTKKFYHCWIDDLAAITDNLPEIYKDTESLLYETWKRLKLDSPMYCYIARMKGDWNKTKYKYYFDNGMLKRTGADVRRLSFYACAPIPAVKVHYLISRIIDYGGVRLKRIWRVHVACKRY